MLRTIQRAALALATIVMTTSTAHAIPHRTSFRTTTITMNRPAPATSAYWQTAFDQRLTAVVVVPMTSPQAVGIASYVEPEPGTFYAQNKDGETSIFDMGDQWQYDAWEPVAPPKALPNVRPGFATLALESQIGANGLPPPVPLPQGPKVPPKNWRTAMINNAKKYLGIPYVWGGNSPQQGLDCSGLVRWVAAMTLGKALPRLASQQSQVGTEVPKEALQPGDLVFFDTARGPATHVGIYVGHNVFINAPHTGAKVRFENLTSDYWVARWHGARRIG